MEGPANHTLTLTAGTVFKHFSTFQQLLDSHCTDTGALFVARCARSVSTHNNAAKTEKGRYPEDWKYVSVRYECKHYGTYESVSKGKRKDQDTFKTGCTARLLLSASKAKGGLVLNEVCLEHAGHTLATDEDARKIYPENRRLTPSQQEEINNLLSLGVSSSNCIKYAKENFDISLVKSDVANIKTKARNGLNEHQQTLAFLQSLLVSDDQASVDICTEEDNTTSIIFLQTKSMKEIFKEYGSVIFLDSTYRVNRRNMPLYVFMIMDGDQCGHVVAYALVLNESAENVKNVLNLFVKNNPNADNTIKTVVIDKDFSSMKALGEVLPSCSIVICKWHVVRAFQRALKGYGGDLQKEIMNVIHKIIFCSTEVMYEQLKIDLQQLSPVFYEDYFSKNWDTLKKSWVGCFTRTILTYGNLTNNVVESHNQKIKFLVNGNFQLTELLKQLLIINSQCDSKSTLKKSKLKLKKKLVITDSVPKDIVKEIYDSCSPYAAKCIYEQMEHVFREIFIVTQSSVMDHGKLYDVSCTACNCAVFVSKKLLCKHIIAYRKENDVKLFSLSDVPHRFLLTTYLKETSVHSQSKTTTAVVPPLKRILNRNEKFNRAKCLTTELATVLSEFGQNKFEEALDMVRSITNSLKQGKVVSWIESDDLVSEVVSVQPEPTLANNEESCQINVDTNDIGEENCPEEPYDINTTLANNEESCQINVDTNDIGKENCPEEPYEINTTLANVEKSCLNVDTNDSEEENCPEETYGINSVEIATSGRLFENSDLLEMPLNNLPFRLPCAIKRKGRPKLPKRSSKKRKLETNVLSERNASRWMALCIDETLVDSVMKGQVLVDNYALRDVDDIDDSIVDCDEDQLQVYFTNDGWLNFLNIILTKRSRLT